MFEQLLPQAKNIVGVAFVIVVVFTLIMTFTPPNRSPLYRLFALLFFVVIAAALVLGVGVLVTTVFRAMK